jgi:hypothetical protein
MEYPGHLYPLLLSSLPFALFSLHFLVLFFLLIYIFTLSQALSFTFFFLLLPNLQFSLSPPTPTGALLGAYFWGGIRQHKV